PSKLEVAVTAARRSAPRAIVAPVPEALVVLVQGAAAALSTVARPPLKQAPSRLPRRPSLPRVLVTRIAPVLPSVRARKTTAARPSATVPTRLPPAPPAPTGNVLISTVSRVPAAPNAPRRTSVAVARAAPAARNVAKRVAHCARNKRPVPV